MMLFFLLCFRVIKNIWPGRILLAMFYYATFNWIVFEFKFLILLNVKVRVFGRLMLRQHNKVSYKYFYYRKNIPAYPSSVFGKTQTRILEKAQEREVPPVLPRLRSGRVGAKPYFNILKNRLKEKTFNHQG